MKRFLLIALGFAFVALAAVAGSAMAQEETPFAPQRGGPMMGQGVLHSYMEAEHAKALGLTVEDLRERHANGETFLQIAEEQGYTLEEAQQLMLDARNAALDAAVADGVITQEQADWMKSRSQRMMGGQGMGPGGCMGGGYQRGGMGGRWSRDG